MFRRMMLSEILLEDLSSIASYVVLFPDNYISTFYLQFLVFTSEFMHSHFKVHLKLCVNFIRKYCTAVQISL